ncbi:MBOAT family O-acyltransferase [Haliscomenobacter sp.]|uniref:MBOAT family O-acyltransferase n=1 Tax=Haliscomenobacter sp. TaxID=2717303 RepID=UPI003BA91CDF
MLFNSFDFTIFLLIVFTLYWFVAQKSFMFQNILLLVSSYTFYACWDWRFLFLLIFSTLLDFYSGIKIAQTKNHILKRNWLYLSIIINLGFLGIFKYYNFFATSFEAVLSNFGLEVNVWTLTVILPVGISFYTFHGLSYVIDVYNDRIKPEINFINYSVFVSFFPLLVAGPIERATHLLPQIQNNRSFDKVKAVDGLRQILWGLFKKVVIADNCAKIANYIFENNMDLTGSTLFIGAIFFAFQIYGDFSGYSDIALGTARLFGIELLRNFAYPYFSRDIAEFWRRWHISLSSWFKDYLYIPLGGNKGSGWVRTRNVFIIFIVSGFWHGANWTFIIWGFLNALYIMPSIIFRSNRINIEVVAKDKILPTMVEFTSICCTFCLTVFAWIFFRAENVTHALEIFSKIFSKSFFTFPFFNDETISKFAILSALFILFFVVIEWIGRREQYAIASFLMKKHQLYRLSFYYFLLIIIFIFAGTNQQFIYFQF